MPWDQPSHANQFMLSYKKVQEWDDSAGLEAFQDAKFCHCAKITNRQCETCTLMMLNMMHVFIDPELVADWHFLSQNKLHQWTALSPM
ncbi:hypothetical protein DsansV1_C06g0062861 [Dioscorea sansibarensis]